MFNHKHFTEGKFWFLNKEKDVPIPAEKKMQRDRHEQVVDIFDYYYYY